MHVAEHSEVLNRLEGSMLLSCCKDCSLSVNQTLASCSLYTAAKLLSACRAEVNSLYERLFYENVLTELGESSEIIYLSVANAALAHLPYLVALDHQSRHAPAQTPARHVRDMCRAAMRMRGVLRRLCLPKIAWCTCHVPGGPG